MLYSFCSTQGVVHKRLGKLIVATDHDQIVTLQSIKQQADANLVTDLQWLSRDDIQAIEPNISALGALLSPSTGIIDSHGFMAALDAKIASHGQLVILRAPVESGKIANGRLELSIGGEHQIKLRCHSVINCAGLWADHISRSIEGLDQRTVPEQRYAIGHYYSLSARAPCQRLVYPVPAPGGLGIHLTLDMAGAARFGPDVRWIERIDYAFDDRARDDFVDSIRAYLPSIDGATLTPDYTGIRPKLAGPSVSFSDFRIDGPAQHGIPGYIALYGIESPGLTASLAIAEKISALVA
jgi:L-2-hydroxyglutarate oxidase LhgO